VRISYHQVSLCLIIASLTIPQILTKRTFS